MIGHPYAHHRPAALALLAQRPTLSRKEAGFLGHVCVAPALTENQNAWLGKLLAREALPPLIAGGAA